MGLIVTQPYKTTDSGGFSSTATYDPASPGFTFSDGDLTATSTTGSWKSTKSLTSVTTGKYYWETIIGGAGDMMVGIVTALANLDSFTGVDIYGYGFYAVGGGSIWNNSLVIQNTFINSGISDNISILLDLDTNFISFWKNGTIVGIPQAITAGTYFPALAMRDLDSQATTNFGATPFVYTPPAGYIPIP